jgi:hypothetical protein
MINTLQKYAPIVGEVEAIQAPPAYRTDIALGDLVAALMGSGKVNGAAIAMDESGLMVSFAAIVKSRGVKLPWGEWLVFIGDKAKVMDDGTFRAAYRADAASHDD